MADSMFKSVLDRDLICQSNPMPMGGSFGNPFSFGMGMYNPYMNTSFLGGITMAPPLTADVYGSRLRTRDRNMNNMKTAGLAILAAAATLFAGIKFHNLFKAISSKLRK